MRLSLTVPLLAGLAMLSGAVQTGFEIRDGIFKDAERERDVAYRAYVPSPLESEHPVVIFSHGLGGSRRGGAYLGEALAAHGFVSFHIQHEGSDESVWSGKPRSAAVRALERSILNPANALNRFRDLPFVVDQIKALNETDPTLKGRLDLTRIGMMGHSYGARSTLIAAGERIGLFEQSFKEPRIRAGVLLSPNLPNREIDTATAYGDVDIPLFHITGTRDGSPLPSMQDTAPEQRLGPYRRINNGADQFLLVLDKADHMTFSARRIGTAAETASDARHVRAVRRGVVLFFGAYLKRDKDARAILRTDYRQELSEADRFERKPR